MEGGGGGGSRRCSDVQVALDTNRLLFRFATPREASSLHAAVACYMLLRCMIAQQEAKQLLLRDAPPFPHLPPSSRIVGSRYARERLQLLRVIALHRARASSSSSLSSSSSSSSSLPSVRIGGFVSRKMESQAALLFELLRATGATGKRTLKHARNSLMRRV